MSNDKYPYMPELPYYLDWNITLDPDGDYRVAVTLNTRGYVKEVLYSNVRLFTGDPEAALAQAGRDMVKKLKEAVALGVLTGVDFPDAG